MESRSQLRSQFIAAVTHGEFALARFLIESLPHDKVGLRDIYLTLLEPAEREIRHLLHKAALDPARAHLMTMLLQEIIEGFSPIIFGETSRPENVLVTTVPGELHEVSPRIVADLLEMEGFDTTLLSSPNSAGAIADSLQGGRFSAALLVVATPSLMPAAVGVAADLRTVPDDYWLAVGGDALRIKPRYLPNLEADAVFMDASEALMVVKSFAGDADDRVD
jgi:methanogenic corrinoid protein MtbC1